MRIFKNKWFSRYARQNKIDDDTLVEAIARANRGLIDADLGGGVIKQRIARRNAGKSGGFRAVIFFRQGDRGFLVYAFGKNKRDNISIEELSVLKKSAKRILELSDSELLAECAAGAWSEMDYGEEVQE